MIINNDDLGIIYLTNKKKEYMTLMHNSIYNNYYIISDNIYLVCPFDKNDTRFKILNMGISKRCDEPIVEISVNPNTTEIFFISHYLGSSKTRIKVRYDDIEKNWDVRIVCKDDFKLSTLDKALNDLKNNYNGEEEYNNFISIINACKNIFNKSMEAKQKKK